MTDHPHPVRRALLSVSDKTGLVDFASALADLGIELISTGGSARVLSDAGLPVVPVEQVTGTPEMMGGRVKTLHPAIHAAILARRDIDAQTLSHHAITPIDLVCVNLYPFEQTIAKENTTLEQAIEQIDIGGPSMIRSAAKNARWVVCLTSPDQYALALEELKTNATATTLTFRQRMAAIAFARTARYDYAINQYLSSQLQSDAPQERFPQTLQLNHTKIADLRYGENPHQQAALYRDPKASGPSVITAEQLNGKPLSYNNVLDASAALGLAVDLLRHDPSRHGAVIVKHTNPCGCATANSLSAAIQHALDGDRLAAFGGIVAVNTQVDHQAAALLAQSDLFFEVIVAPSYTPDALAMLKRRSAKLRLLATGPFNPATAHPHAVQVKTLQGGSLAQTTDDLIADPATWTHAAGPAPSQDLLHAAAVLDSVSRSLTSNAIAIGNRLDDDSIALFGAGAGQMDRVASCRIAIEKAAHRAKGAVAVSDAFFPFADGPELLAAAGISMIVHPGGSKRDQDTFDLCNRLAITCMTTGFRRFRH